MLPFVLRKTLLSSYQQSLHFELYFQLEQWSIHIPFQDWLWDQQPTVRGTFTGVIGAVQFVAEKQIIHKPGLLEPVFCFTNMLYFDITKLNGPSPVLWLALLCSIWTLTPTFSSFGF